MDWLEDLQRKIGTRVREVRKDKGLTQARLAELAGLPTETVNRVERGVEPNPTLRVLGSIAKALGLALHDLFVPDAGYRVSEQARAFSEIGESLASLSRYDVKLIGGLSRRMKELAGSKKREGKE